MEENIYRIKGWFKKQRKKMSFTKEILAHSEDRARELLYSEIGSKHAVKRNLIEIKKVKEIEPEEAENRDIRVMMMEEE